MDREVGKWCRAARQAPLSDNTPAILTTKFQLCLSLEGQSAPSCCLYYIVTVEHFASCFECPPYIAY